MKPRFIYALAVIVAAMGMTSCQGGGGSGKLKELEFKRMHLDGINALALASISSDAQNAPRRAPAAEGDTVYDMRDPIYSVSEDGTLVEVSYTINCRGNGEIIDMVQAHMRLAMEYIYPIGDDWLWLYNCRYDYPELDQVAEPYRSMLAEKCNPLMSKHFLVRLKDGALFEWDYNILPYLEYDIEGHPLAGNRRPSDIYTIVESMKGEVYCLSEYSDARMVYQLKDEGDYLNVRMMHENTLYFESILPDNRGAIGGDIGYRGGEWGWTYKTGVLFPNTLDIVAITSDEHKEANWYVSSINGTLYAIAVIRGYGTAFYALDLQESPVAQAKVGELLAELPDIETVAGPISKTETLSWLDHNKKFTFDPKGKKVTHMDLPDYYPDNERDYYDNIAYIMNNDEHSFYICDLSKDAAEQVVIDWSEYDAYQAQIVTEKPFGKYDPSTQSFQKTAITMNGKQLTIMVDVAGENKGKARVFKPGESTAGQVISVMVRLN